MKDDNVHDPSNVRPDWVPQRYEWWPGESEQKIVNTIREASLSDWAQVARLLRVPLLKAHRWITQHGYSVWVIARNRRTIVACIVARHGPGETTVLRFYCDPGFPRNAIITKFAALLRAEMPEWRVTWKTQPSDDASGLTDHLRVLQWKAESCDDETGRTKFYRSPLIER